MPPKEIYAARGKFTSVCCTESKIYDIKYLRADLVVEKEDIKRMLKDRIASFDYCVDSYEEG